MILIKSLKKSREKCTVFEIGFSGLRTKFYVNIDIAVIEVYNSLVMKKINSQGMALISIVISLVITAILIVVVLTLYTGGKTGEDDVITSPIERSKSVQCLSQIRRLDIGIQMFLAENSRYPASLDELEDFSEDEFYCPATNNKYNYNSGSGKITCPDHP